MALRRYRPTSHEAFSHENVDTLGYDWSWAANPDIAPKRPLKVYFPRTTEDIVRVVREMKTLREKQPDLQLLIRGSGHSSNDLVLVEGGAVLCTQYLNHVIELTDRTVTVQPGVVLAQLDEQLGRRGYGLPVIGDHDHITAGGFASVGGVSPASHVHGLFVDNVEALEYVDWHGDRIRCSETEHPDLFKRVLAGTGQYGVIASLTCRILKVDKWRTVLRNTRMVTRDVERFVRESTALIAHPGEARMERGVWFDMPILGKPFAIGQVSAYHDTAQSWLKRLRNRVAHAILHGIGYLAGWQLRPIDMVLQYLGVAGVVFSPRYASQKNIEVFVDKIIDSTVGDPSRMLIVFAPAAKYDAMFRALYELCKEYRAKEGCFTYLSFYVKGITSAYLAPDGQRFCELVLYLGIRPENLPEELLERLVIQIDDLCIEHGGFRYMHTRTSKTWRRAMVDPNAALHTPIKEQGRRIWTAGGDS